jgi:TolB protein
MKKENATVPIITAVVTLVCLGTASLCAGDSQPTDNNIWKAGKKYTGAKNTSGLKGQIVFQSDRDGNVEVFRINADGKKIVYSSNRNGFEDIWIMDADGSNKKKLTNNDRKEAHGPNFSPDGKAIVFLSDIKGKHGDKMQVWTVGIDGKNLKCLTDREAFHSGVDYSPCGKYIAYKSPWDGYWNIYI